MKILVSSRPGVGHVHPIVPFASALQRAGHEIVWATAPEASKRIEGYGFRALAAGVVASGPSTREQPAQDPGAQEVPRERRAQFFGTRFAGVARHMQRDLAPIVDAMEPDVIVHDMAELATAPIAAARGIPHVTVAFSGPVSDSLLQGIVHNVVDLWEAEGVEVPDDAGLYGDLYLHRFPPAFGPAPDHDNVRWVRPVGFDGPGEGEAPPWLPAIGSDRPAVYLTLGTVVNSPAQWRAILSALDSLDVDAIATVGTQVDPAAIGPVPSNIQLERYVPQSLILGRVDVLISHAGAGTLLAGASLGLPQMCLPMGADMWDNADALSRTGSSLTLEEDDRSAAAILSSLERLLEDRSFATAAANVAVEIAELPHPDTYIPAVEALLRS